jgi:hypothetical protein
VSRSGNAGRALEARRAEVPGFDGHGGGRVGGVDRRRRRNWLVVGRRVVIGVMVGRGGRECLGFLLRRLSRFLEVEEEK